MLEFTVCRGVVHELSTLKARAQQRSRLKGIPMHRSLEDVATSLGARGGWHELVMTKWVLQNDDRLYQAHASKPLMIEVDFPDIQLLPAVSSSRRIVVHQERTARSGIMHDLIKIRSSPEGGVQLTGALALGHEEYRRLGTRAAAARFMISVADRVSNNWFENVPTFVSEDRKNLELSMEFGSATGSLYFLDHAAQEGSPRLSLLVLPSGERGDQVKVLARHGNQRFESDMTRSGWLYKLRAFVAQHGLPEERPSTAASLLRHLGFRLGPREVYRGSA